jgi:exonuclease III
MSPNISGPGQSIPAQFLGNDGQSAAWGDPIPVNKDNTQFRIFGFNIGGLSFDESTGGPAKFDHLHLFVNQYDPDVICLSETGLLWKKLPEHRQLQTITREWWKGSKCYTAYNTQTKTNTNHLHGGVAIIIRNNRANSVIDHGKDPSGLGRWVWVRLQGFSGRTVFILSGYRPVKHASTRSVYGQHQDHFNHQSPVRLECPREAFIKDLIATISAYF